MPFKVCRDFSRGKRGKPWSHPHRRYHARFGLPVDVFIDLMENAVDEEHGFIVEAFDLQ